MGATYNYKPSFQSLRGAVAHPNLHNNSARGVQSLAVFVVVQPHYKSVSILPSNPQFLENVLGPTGGADVFGYLYLLAVDF